MRGKPTRPQDFPEFRNSLVADDNLWAFLPVLDNLVGGAHRRDFAHAWHIREEMESARLWWLGADACDLVDGAWQSMPPATLTREFIPDKAGLLCFERPHEGIDADHPTTVMVDYMLWFPTIVQEHDCLSIICWHTGTLSDGTAFTSPLGRADWLLGTDTDEVLPGVEGRTMTSVVEDRRLLATIWQLSSQASITETVDQVPDRATRRRLERRGRPVPEVRIVNLAARHRAATEAPGGHRDVEWTRRWIVSGHWRQQACGPGRTQHRPVYIAPFIKGPEDKPLVVNEPVKVWRG